MGIVKKILIKWRNFIRLLNRKQRFLGLFIHFIVTTLGAFIMFMVSTVFLVGTTTVQGDSMKPTLRENDRLITLKIQPFLSHIFGYDYIPQRGEIIIFKKRGAEDELLIKRVVGLPGEYITIEHQIITIYNQEFPHGFEPDLELDKALNIFSEYEIFKTHIATGEIFVLGDNRNVSIDSRIIGNILIEDIISKLIIRTWPITNFEIF